MTLGPDTLTRYPNPYFIETGTFKGAGVEAAVAAGYKHIVSIEVGPQLAIAAQSKFRSNPNVRIIQGDARYVLGKVISNIQEPITFWLDGHYSGRRSAMGDVNDPIVYELQAIAEHPIKTHTILIDDMRGYNQQWRGDIKKALDVINPGYVITYENGYVPNDIMVARCS